MCASVPTVDDRYGRSMEYGFWHWGIISEDFIFLHQLHPPL